MHEIAINKVSYAYGSNEVLRDITFTAEAG